MTIDVQDIIESINSQMEELIGTCRVVAASELGLDRRAGYRFYVNDTSIIVDKRYDRSLQYYGGFEYVDPDCRIALGEYVVYTNEDTRVAGHIDRLEIAEEDNILETTEE